MPRKGRKQRNAGGQSTETGLDASAASRGVDVELLVPDPDWVDIEPLPDARGYTAFSPPRVFEDGMLKDKDRWATSSDPSTVRTVASAIAKVVQPRLVDLCLWREHVADFLKRLCLHRRLTSDRNAEALTSLQRRVDQLERRMRDIEQGQHESDRSPGPPCHRGARRGRSPPRDEEPVHERVLRAQLAAAAARSLSPALSATSVLLDYAHRYGSDHARAASPFG